MHTSCIRYKMPLFFSESPHGDPASAEDVVQDVGTETHTSEDGMLLAFVFICGFTMKERERERESERKGEGERER